MLLKSLFDPEPAAVPTPAATPAIQPEAEVASAPAAADCACATVTAHAMHRDETHDTATTPHPTSDPLLDRIDALGEIVLTLDTQLRAQNASHTALCQRLHGELGALRRMLR